MATLNPLCEETRHRLLVVDDSYSNRALLVRWFQLRGFEAVEAEGGEQAIRLIDRIPFDVVLLDVMMPDIGGMEVLRRIREKHSLADLPVIMVTGNTDSEDIVEALEAEANDYITKPVDLEVALARVQTQIRRRQAEDAIRRANDDLERQLRGSAVEGLAEQHNLLADISHEIRTPLNGVVSLVSVLAGTELQPNQRQMVSIIESSAATLERLLTDMLDQAKAASGRLEVRSDPFLLTEAVGSVAALWEMKAREKGLRFSVEIAQQADRRVYGDAVRLKQILNNLLSNAVKFTEAGSVRLTLTADGEACRITVRDTGIGFDAGVKGKLFTRFQQADSSISSRFGGTGLGLAISRELARLMGGELDCASVYGEGATFTLDLPLPPAEEDQASLQTSAARAGSPSTEAKPLRVLLAEDHPINRKVIQMLLQPIGIDLVSVENGADAFEAFTRESFDLVLMDVQMPIMDGVTAIRMIRDWERETGAPAAPIVVLTAHNLPEHVRASLAAGANAHLGKPVNAAELLGTIARLTGASPEERAGEARAAS